MKALLFATMMALTLPLAAAEKELTDKQKFEDELSEGGISYVWNTTDNTMAVFHDVDPRTVCEMSDKYPAVGLVKVVNYGKQISASCVLPK